MTPNHRTAYNTSDSRSSPRSRIVVGVRFVHPGLCASRPFFHRSFGSRSPGGDRQILTGICYRRGLIVKKHPQFE